MATPTRAVFPLVVALLAGGCGGVGQDSAPPVAASSDPSPSPTAEAEAPASASDATSPDPTDSPSPAEEADPSPSPSAAAAAAAPCTADDSRLEPTVPDQASRVEEVTADLDGDGAADRVVTYAIEGQDTATFLLRVITDAGYVVEASLDQASSIAPVEPMGAARIGTERDVVVVAEATGASAVLVSVWGFAEFDGAPCALARLTTDGEPGELHPVGGSLAGGGGLACRDVTDDDRSELVISTTERTGEERWQWREQAWTWTGSMALEVVAEDTGEAQTQEELAPYVGLDCPGVQFPGDDA